jgi:hypothetical protein
MMIGDDDKTGLDSYVLRTARTTLIVEPEIVTLSIGGQTFALPRSEWDHLVELVKGNPS